MCRDRQSGWHTEIRNRDSKKKKKAAVRGADHFRPACGVIPRRGSPPAEPVIPSLYKTANREKFEQWTKCWLQCLFEIRGSKILLDYLADFTERQADTEGFVPRTLHTLTCLLASRLTSFSQNKTKNSHLPVSYTYTAAHMHWRYTPVILVSRITCSLSAVFLKEMNIQHNTYRMMYESSSYWHHRLP